VQQEQTGNLSKLGHERKVRYWRLRYLAEGWCFHRSICAVAYAKKYCCCRAYRDQIVIENESVRQTYLTRHGTHFRKVTVRWDIKVNNNYIHILEELLCGCPNVLEFDCYQPVVPATQICIAEYWKQLTHLTMDECLIGEEFVVLGESCQSLIELTLLDKSAATYPCFGQFLQVLSPLLQAFTTQTELKPFDYTTIASRCHSLKKLSADTINMDDDALIALGVGCRLLTELNLAMCPVTDTGIHAVAQNGALIALCLDNCSRITDEGIQYVVECCPQLEVFDIWSCTLTDATVIALGQQCRELRVLSLGDTSVTHEGLQAIADGCPLLEEFRACSFEAGPKVQSIARSCPRLREIEICRGGTDASRVLPAVKRFDSRG
jgi:hypothetical protein